MDTAITGFARALRVAGVAVSTVETLDAARTAGLLGWNDRAVLRDAFGMVFAKSEDDKVLHDEVFDRYFALTKTSQSEGDHAAAEDSSTATEENDLAEQLELERAAQAAGVVVLALDSPIGTFVNSTIKTNNTAAGYAVGRYSYLSHPGDDGQVAVLFCPIAYDQNIFDRIVGFVSGYDINVQYSDYGEEEEDRVVNYYTDPDIVAAREYQCSVAESAEKGMIDILDNVKNGTSSMPSLVYATNEVGAFGVLAALQKRGLENKIRIATIDGSCYGVEAVRDGLFSVEAIQRPEKMGELGILELDRWLTYGINPFDVDAGFDLIVDAILGTGLSAALRDPVSNAVKSINDSGIPVVSIDVPTGLNADTGMMMGDCVVADMTVTMAALKQGLLFNDGPRCSGEIIVAESARIGDTPRWLRTDDPRAPQAYLSGPLYHLRPRTQAWW